MTLDRRTRPKQPVTTPAVIYSPRRSARSPPLGPPGFGLRHWGRIAVPSRRRKTEFSSSAAAHLYAKPTCFSLFFNALLCNLTHRQGPDKGTEIVVGLDLIHVFHIPPRAMSSRFAQAVTAHGFQHTDQGLEHFRVAALEPRPASRAQAQRKPAKHGADAKAHWWNRWRGFGGGGKSPSAAKKLGI